MRSDLSSNVLTAFSSWLLQLRALYIILCVSWSSYDEYLFICEQSDANIKG